MWFLKKREASDASNEPQTQKEALLHNESGGLFVENRQLGWLAAAMFAIVFFSFITGYFLGKKKGLELFATENEHSSLSDRIYTALFALSDRPYTLEESCATQSEEIVVDNHTSEKGSNR